MKKEIAKILETMSNVQLLAVYMSLEDGNSLKKKAHRIIWERGNTIGGLKKYHGLKNGK
jgi:hypothetical protein